MGDSQGRGQDRGLASGRERVLTRGPAPVPVPLLAQGHGRATGEPVTENAPIILAPEAGLGVAAGVAARNPNAEEREVVRRIERRENGGRMGRHQLLWATSGVNMGSSANLISLQKRQNSVLGL
jgi:hypothetical protein